MNDRFRVRIWDKSFRKMLYNNLILCYKNKITAYDYLDNAHKAFLPESHIIIEQCTGLKDKNGRLIYEGDILATSNNDPKYDLWKPEDWGYAVVYWNEKNLCFAGTKWFIDGPEEESVFNAEFVEVVGNIHENPELLEVQK